MRLELAERLRCPAGHVPTPLIVVARRVVDCELISGVAGCPVCTLEARVEAGVIEFPAPYAIVVAADASEAAGPVGAPDAERAAPEDAIERAAALLGLAEPGGAVLLAGRYGVLAAALRDRLDVVTAVLRTPGAVPFTDATFRAAALDLPGAPLDDAVRAVTVGGRVVAPAAAALPAALRELARDAIEWVAEREATSPVVSLGRASPPHRANR